MTTQPTSPEEKKQERDPDIAASEAAIKRAAQKARDRARTAGTGIIVMQDGKIKEAPPDTPV